MDFSKLGYHVLWIRIKTLGNYKKRLIMNRVMNKFAEECQRVEMETELAMKKLSSGDLDSLE